jgi:flagella basal body P-ring formation protein FlgA
MLKGFKMETFNFIKHLCLCRTYQIFRPSNQVLTLLIVTLTAYSADLVSVTFKDSVCVNESLVLLEDVASIESKMESIAYKTASIQIGEAAPPGFSRYFTGDDVVQLVANKSVKGIKISIFGAKRVKVFTSYQEKQIKNYSTQIVNFLRQKILWNTNDYSLSIENPEYSWKCYNSSSKFCFKEFSNLYPKGNTRLNCTFSQGDNFEVTIPVICHIKVKAQVVIAREEISRNSIIRSFAVELQKIDITDYHYSPVMNLSDVIGKIALKTITPGTILHDKCIKTPPLIIKGDIVAIFLKNNAIEVTIQAKARENGCKGDIIWVENLSSHKLIRAKITGRGSVQLLQGSAV